MKADDVMAVVVSFNGREATRQAVLALSGQVGHIHVVDNGSGQESIDILDSLERENLVSVERLGRNCGIGHALNLGIAHAKSIGCNWLLTMDQDSVANSDMIGAYQSVVAERPHVISLSPRLHGRPLFNAPTSVEIKSAITSGNLVEIGVFDEIGVYDEGFFIDCIDFDFSLRLRRAGYSLRRVENAHMHHQLGEATKLPWLIGKFYARHSPLRRYYMTRNYLYLAERYVLRFPVFVIKLGILRVVLLVLIAFFDPNPLRSFRAIARGLCDYAMRRVGPYRGTAT